MNMNSQKFMLILNDNSHLLNSQNFKKKWKKKKKKIPSKFSFNMNNIAVYYNYHLLCYLLREQGQ